MIGEDDGVGLVRRAVTLLMAENLASYPTEPTRLWRLSPDVRAELGSLVTGNAGVSSPTPFSGSRLLGYPTAVDDQAAAGTLELVAL